MARKLLLLNGLAILGVVLNHSVAECFVAMFWWADRYRDVQSPNFDQLGSLTYYVLRLLEQLLSYSVPAFLFVSGFFVSLAGAGSNVNRFQIVWRRCLSLAIPYVIWSALAVAAAAYNGIVPGPERMIRGLLLGRAAHHYYFIPLLIQLYLLSPVLTSLAKKNWKILLVSCGAIHVFARSLNYFQLLGIQPDLVRALLSWRPTCLFVNGIFWFALGVVAMQNLSALSGWLSRTWKIWLAAWIILVAAGCVEWEVLLRSSGQEWIAYFDTLCDALCAGAFILTFLGFTRLQVPFAKQLSDMGTKSFGIFLTHGIGLAIAAKGVYHVAPSLLAYQSVFFLILVVCGAGIPLLAMYLVQKTCSKRVYAYIFG